MAECRSKFQCPRLRKGPGSDDWPNGGGGVSSGGAAECAAGHNRMGRAATG